jgi:Domain of unknown function (DUF6950)
MADLSTALSDYLASLAGKRWQPGALDCGVFMADWVLQITGIDPIADVRGRYRTARQFLRIVRAEGGFERSCRRRLEAVGYRPVAQPGAGDLAIVLAPYAARRGKLQRRPTGAICAAPGHCAVITSDLGLVIAGADRLPVAAAWGLSDG